ncbi:EamA family transporter [Dactylosporangium cerinum]
MTAPAPNAARWLPAFLAIALIWGTSFMFIKDALAELEPVYIAGYRILLGALTLLIFLFARGCARRAGRGCGSTCSSTRSSPPRCRSRSSATPSSGSRRSSPASGTAPPRSPRSSSP